MIAKEMLVQLLAEVEMKEAPLTTVAAGAYKPEFVDKFIDTVKASGKKALTDMVRTFCSGKAHHKRCIWTNDFKRMAIDHFGATNFEDFFTKEGKQGQAIAKELHRQTARKSELSRKVGKAGMDMANRLQQLCKIGELYGAKFETIDDAAFRVEVPRTGKNAGLPIVFTVDALGIQSNLPENTVDALEQGRESSRVHLEN